MMPAGRLLGGPADDPVSRTWDVLSRSSFEHLGGSGDHAGDGRADGDPGDHVARIVHAEHKRDNAIGGTSRAGSGSPVGRASSTAAAAVDVACADGKLSRLGVPTFTAIAG